MRRLLIIFISLLAIIIGSVANQAIAGKPSIMKGCTNCHKAEPGRVRGKLVNYSPKFSSVHLNVGPLVWIIKYDENTKLEGTASLDKVKKGKEMSVVFTGDENSPLATKISIKKPFKLPDDKLVSLDEMKELVYKGPDKGGYLLVDSRPPGAYNSGHLPGAVSIPFPKLKKMKEKVLPADKNSRVIFYCGGFT